MRRKKKKNLLSGKKTLVATYWTTRRLETEKRGKKRGERNVGRGPASKIGPRHPSSISALALALNKAGESRKGEKKVSQRKKGKKKEAAPIRRSSQPIFRLRQRFIPANGGKRGGKM